MGMKLAQRSRSRLLTMMVTISQTRVRLTALKGEGQVAFRYADDINGAQRRIAGVMNAKGNVLGMMPHPERDDRTSPRRLGRSV